MRHVALNIVFLLGFLAICAAADRPDVSRDLVMFIFIAWALPLAWRVIGSLREVRFEL